MLRFLGRITVFSALAVLSACGGQPAIPFDRAIAVDVKTIAIVTPAFPTRPRVVLATTVGRSFGPIGALIDAGMEDSRNSSFTSMLSTRSFAATDAFVQRLTAALQTQGYTVVILPAARDKQDFLQAYPPSATNPPVDAYLDVVVPAYGYVAAGISDNTPYRPIFMSNNRLVRAADRSVLMQDSVVYNPLNPNGKYITIAPDPAYTFVDFDTLMADPPRTVAGLDAAVTQTAGAIAGLLH
jgi:hypothetical protein